MWCADDLGSLDGSDLEDLDEGEEEEDEEEGEEGGEDELESLSGGLESQGHEDLCGQGLVQMAI